MGVRYTGCPKTIVLRNVAEFLLRGIRSVRIWLFWDAEQIYAKTRSLAQNKRSRADVKITVHH